MQTAAMRRLLPPVLMNGSETPFVGAVAVTTAMLIRAWKVTMNVNRQQCSKRFPFAGLHFHDPILGKLLRRADLHRVRRQPPCFLASGRSPREDGLKI